MGLLRNGMEEFALPVKLRGAGATGNVRTCWTRGWDVIGPHHFTSAWTEKIPNAATMPYVLPMKVAVVPGTASSVYHYPQFAMIGVGV